MHPYRLGDSIPAAHGLGKHVHLLPPSLPNTALGVVELEQLCSPPVKAFVAVVLCAEARHSRYPMAPKRVKKVLL